MTVTINYNLRILITKYLDQYSKVNIWKDPYLYEDTMEPFVMFWFCKDEPRILLRSTNQQ